MAKKTPSPRRGAAERILNAAVERLLDEGPRLGLANVSLEGAIGASGVSRATAYRRWPDRNAFAAEVLITAIRRSALVPDAPGELTNVFDFLVDRAADVATAAGRRTLVVESLRLLLRADIERTARSAQWRTVLSLSALHPWLPEDGIRAEIGRTLSEVEDRFDAQRASVYHHLLPIFGYRVADGDEGALSVEELAATMGTLTRGLVFRAVPDPAWLRTRTRARLFGSTTESDWSAPERMLARTLLAHLEPDPDAEVDPEIIIHSVASAEAAIRGLAADAREGSAPVTGRASPAIDAVPQVGLEPTTDGL